jgi:hypothetical protein
MLRIGGTTPVAEKEQLVTAFEDRDDGIDDVRQCIKIIAQKRLLDANAFVEGLADGGFHALFS